MPERPSQPLAVVPGPSQAGFDTFRNDVSLQLGHGRNDRKDGSTQRRAGVYIFLVADEIDAQILEFLQGQNQVLGASGEPIKAPDQNDIKAPLSGIVHQSI